MKKRILLAAFALFSFAAAVSAQNTPVVDGRENNQKARIREGVKDGDLTKKEAANLRKQQRHIKHTEAKAKSDGVVTPAERAKLDRKQDRASRRIAKQKHDGQTRN